MMNVISFMDFVKRYEEQKYCQSLSLVFLLQPFKNERSCFRRFEGLIFFGTAKSPAGSDKRAALSCMWLGCINAYSWHYIVY